VTVPQVQISARDHYLALLDPLPLSGAIAIASVLYRESRLDPGSQGVQATERGGVRNPHGAYGIASWNGPRQQDYTTFCDVNHLEYDNLYNQLDFVLHEMANHYPLSWAAIRSGAAYQSIIEVVVDEYENPKDKAAEIRDAIVIADALAKAPLTHAPSPAPAPTPVPAPLPQAPRPPTPPPTPPPIVSSADIHHTTFQDNVGRYRDFLITERDSVVAEFNSEISALNALLSSQATSAATQGPILMNQTKPAIASTGVWGSIISIGVPFLSQIADTLGHSVDPKLQAIGSILGGLLALYGRVSATAQITGVLKS
jgi:Phage tail lysozyme